MKTKSIGKKTTPPGLKRKVRQLRGLRRELLAEWREMLLTLEFIIEELEGQ